MTMVNETWQWGRGNLNPSSQSQREERREGEAHSSLLPPCCPATLPLPPNRIEPAAPLCFPCTHHLHLCLCALWPCFLPTITKTLHGKRLIRLPVTSCTQCDMEDFSLWLLFFTLHLRRHEQWLAHACVVAGDVCIKAAWHSSSEVAQCGLEKYICQW